MQGYTPAPEHSRSSIGVRKYIATNDRQASSVQAAGTSSESVKVNNQYEKLGRPLVLNFDILSPNCVKL